MDFAIDYNNTGGGLLAPGTYEAVIKAAFEDVTQGGTMHISIPLVVRNDIEQSNKNSHIFHKIWKKKEPNEADIKCGGYIAAQINAIGKAAGIPDRKPYKSLDELFGDLRGKPVRVTVKHEVWNDKPQIKVDAVGASHFPDCKHVFKADSEPCHAGNIMVNGQHFATSDPGLNDEDLPF
jgi:hypothetical protein